VALEGQQLQSVEMEEVDGRCCPEAPEAAASNQRFEVFQSLGVVG
jgi:hypothetical protein